MSHDIRTPMNAIMGMTSIALTHIDEKPRVLAMSRIASGRMTLSEEVFSLADMVHDITIIVRPQAAQKHQEFHLEIRQICEETLIGDPLHLRQTLRILQDEELQQKTPDLPWDRYIYMTHQQMASSISYNRENDMTPQDVTAVMESVHIVHSHRIQKAVSRNESPPCGPHFTAMPSSITADCSLSRNCRKIPSAPPCLSFYRGAFRLPAGCIFTTTSRFCVNPNISTGHASSAAYPSFANQPRSLPSVSGLHDT